MPEPHRWQDNNPDEIYGNDPWNYHDVYSPDGGSTIYDPMLGYPDGVSYEEWIKGFPYGEDMVRGGPLPLPYKFGPRSRR